LPQRGSHQRAQDRDADAHILHQPCRKRVEFPPAARVAKSEDPAVDENQESATAEDREKKVKNTAKQRVTSSFFLLFLLVQENARKILLDACHRDAQANT
jgi:hypothetical protein